MSSIDILNMCLRNLFKRKLRSVLTMLGVVIGTVAIVVTVSLGLAVDARFDDMIEGMGDITVIEVQSFANRNFVVWGEETPDEMPYLDTSATNRFADIPHVETILPVLDTWDFSVRSGGYARPNARVLGVRPEAMAAMGYQIAEGRHMYGGGPLDVVFGAGVELSFLSINEMRAGNWNSDRQMSMWMGTPIDELETYVDIFNDRIMLSTDQSFIFGDETQDQDIAFGDAGIQRAARPIELNVVGELEYRPQDWMVNNSIFMDIELVNRMRIDAQRQHQQDSMMWLGQDDAGNWHHINANANVMRDIGYDIAYVRVDHIDNVASVAAQIIDMGFSAWYQTSWLINMQDMARTNQQMLGAIGAISLFVAAIGIANTMVMSTYERTREIGVMKVIGASLADIKKLFLLEAAMIGFFGGVFGVLLSYLVSYLMNNHMQMAFMGGMMDWMMGEQQAAISLITPWLSGAALLFASLIGLVSGYFPARRATKLSALNAIRTE